MTQQGTVERTRPGRNERLPRHVRVFLRLSGRGLPEPVCDAAVERGIEMPAADGTRLLADHYRPLAAGPWPTLLVRSPYGRGFPWDHLFGAMFARQGFHVVLQSCRGTGGSEGEFDPFRNEPADGQATVAWLRRQDWFTGSLGTIGPSYLGYVQWALAADPPPELRAMVVQVSSDDFHGFVFPGGAFALEATLTGTAAMLSMDRGFGAFLLAGLRLARKIKRVERTLPLIDAYPEAFGRRAGFFEDWLARPDPDDAYWVSRRATVVPANVPPVSLLTGWWDACLDPTLAVYRRLRDGGREVRLTVGPWNHASGFNDNLPVLFTDALSWLRSHLNDRAVEHAELPRQPVRVHVGEIGGPGEWRDLPDWPPPAVVRRTWHLRSDGTLAAEPQTADGVSAFRYDPAAPTPSVGGPILDSRRSGPRRNDALEARPDVLTFTGPPLRAPLEIIGPVGIRLQVRASSPHFDVFARLCDVDPRGRSWNICDGIVRLGGNGGDVGPPPASGELWTDVTVPMSATAHRLGTGHRLRVQVSAGAHPRFARNTGTGEPLATATRLVPVDIEIGHGPGLPSVLTLPEVR